MMKNKMFTRVLGMTCALIMAVTAIVPVCAKESGDQANSFRYENGQAAVQASTFADVYPNAWKKIAGKYRSSNGSIIQGAIARGSGSDRLAEGKGRWCGFCNYPLRLWCESEGTG